MDTTYSKFSVFCSLLGKERTIKQNLSFNDICKWLTENKQNLFGYNIICLSESWPADYFL